jgi:hypothetical protein
VPKKGPLSITDFNAMCDAITVRDLQLVVEVLGFGRDGYYSAVGKTIQPEGVELSEDDGPPLVRAPVGSTRGGPLMD